jgi:hypothetical protein
LHRRNSASFRSHIQNCAVVVVEGATISPLHMEPPPCSRLDFSSGIGLFCWLIFTLAAYALLFFVGLCVFMLALHSGAGVLGAPILGIAAGGMTLAIGQIAFAMTRSVIIRAIIAALFAVPAALAGYQVVFAMSQLGVPSLVWREIFACLGAIFIGGTAWTRLTIFTGPARSIRTRQSGAILNRFSQPQHISNDPAPSARRACRLQRRAERRPASLSER